MAHREAWIDRCLALLLYPSGSVADSANWLLQGFGRQGAIALFNRAQRESPDNKALYLAWLSKNGHISHSPAFENEVYEAWLIGLASSDKKLKKHCLIALLDNSPWRAEPVRSFETSQDYNILLPRLVAVLEEFEADTEEEYRKLAAFYKEVLAL
ncbi:hypothetical protein SAMN05421823_111108 [Catalinimonas alkaloidigena]|uniref:Uncharacterized protein n=2 Tax=Catalinimonas alkaloidigena TaxID=1075417 RepID=A0A1G9REK7_9BACT|nr:hypothetical protein SAMN05421823_111108 [Catalinimonas alkaloidigena]